jgi:hypothetical protein
MEGEHVQAKRWHEKLGAKVVSHGRYRGTAAAATTSASMRRSTVMRSRATDGMSASECQGKRPDQAVKHRSDGRECREPSTLSHLSFQPVQKTPTIHVSSGFIWGIPDQSK